jgi:uncharacterized damage-inducible protein DinB
MVPRICALPQHDYALAAVLMKAMQGVSRREATMTEKEQLLGAWEREFPTTLKVLKAFPTAKSDLKPQAKCRSAKDLAWTFVVEQTAGQQALDGAIDLGKIPPPPGTLQEVISTFERTHRAFVERVKKTPEAELNKTVKFFVAPKQMGDMRKLDVLWFMLMDSVHHRGQLTVYLRMADGKVPSIYGPSADEPWL